MPVTDDRVLLTGLVELALRAGALIMDVYATDFAVERKADNSVVTEADRLAEQEILAGLRGLAPDVPVIAEEEVASGRIPEIGDAFFLVDPLDGTREFLARNGEFTVNIALIEHGVPVTGVVYAPALGRLYAGGPSGAFKADVREGVLGPATPIAVREMNATIRAVGSRSHGSEATAAWLARFPEVSFVSAGSSLKFCLVAEGEADIYPRFGRTMEWDTAAGDAVLRSAGGAVVTCDGKPLSYGKRHQATDTDYANSYFIAYGAQEFAQSILGPTKLGVS